MSWSVREQFGARGELTYNHSRVSTTGSLPNIRPDFVYSFEVPTCKHFNGNMKYQAKLELLRVILVGK